MPSIERVFQERLPRPHIPQAGCSKKEVAISGAKPLILTSILGVNPKSAVIHDQNRPGKKDRQPKISLPAAVPVKALKICTVSIVTFSDVWPDLELEYDSHLLHYSSYKTLNPRLILINQHQTACQDGTIRS